MIRQRQSPNGVNADAGPYVRAWWPQVPGITEVFHAQFVGHAYPMHTHDAWTLLIVDDGAIRFDLEQDHHGASGAASVTLLPPNVAHDGRAASAHGFRKRVLYLDTTVLDETLVGAAVEAPSRQDPGLRAGVHALHQTLAAPGDALEAESRLAVVCQRLRRNLGRPPDEPPDVPGPRLAEDLRDLLDTRTTAGITLQEAGAALNSSSTALIRCFTRRFGMPPHAYLTGRRVDRARSLLLAGESPAAVAASVGFYDQSHLTRHFLRHVGTTPGRYAGRR